MQRAAITQSALSKERRELRAAQREAEMDNVPRDIGKTWIDPVPGGTGTGGAYTVYTHCVHKVHVYICIYMIKINESQLTWLRTAIIYHTSLDESHPMRRTRFCQYQVSSVALGCPRVGVLHVMCTQH